MIATAVTGIRNLGRCDALFLPGLRLRCSDKAVLPSVKHLAECQCADRCGAGQRVTMAGPDRAGQSWAAQPGSAEILIADAIGDTLPERVMEFG